MVGRVDGTLVLNLTGILGLFNLEETPDACFCVSYGNGFGLRGREPHERKICPIVVQ